MRACAPASQRLKAIRDNIRGAAHGGIRLDSEQTIVFAQQLTTILELVLNTEEEVSILTAALDRNTGARDNRQTAATINAIASATGSNVTLFPVRKPLASWPSDGEGGAA
ncbi:hypothetical protein [Ensifer soli]|uniref:hypothetical protein n=1 Tax=Ciceribacter sp. sgz301302 TaxID=3342379 RepID=UPI0035B9CE3B